MSLNKDQQKAFKLLKAGFNVFLTGEAGTGKSYLTNYFISHCLSKEKAVSVCAPTGIAAINVSGVTMHRLFNLPLTVAFPLKSISKNTVIENTDVLIIDEISMCRIDMFERIAQVISASNPKLQIVVVGDFLQLPPICKDEDLTAMKEFGMPTDCLFAFAAKGWKKFNLQTIQLKEQCRQSNSEMISSLNQVRVGTPTGLDFFNKNAKKTKIANAITICTTNKAVQAINSRELAKIKSQPKTYKAKKQGSISASDVPVLEYISLKVGAKVRMCMNDAQGRWVNGSVGTITSMGERSVVVLIDGTPDSYKIEPYLWEIEDYRVVIKGKKKILEKVVVATFEQIPVALAYAITVHKSQGQTYEKVNLSLGRCFCDGQLYVALSRASSIKTLAITSKINDSDLLTNQDVLNFLGVNQASTHTHGGFRSGAGRKGMWGEKVKMKTIKIPEHLADEVMEYARKLNNRKQHD